MDSRPQDRELLEGDAQIVVLREQGLQRGPDAPAVAAAIVEEFDQHDGALGIAGDRCLRIRIDLVAMALNGLLGQGGGLRIPLGLQRLLDLDQQLRLLEEIVADDLPDCLHRQIAERRGVSVAHGLGGSGGIAAALLYCFGIADDLCLSRPGGGEGEAKREAGCEEGAGEERAGFLHDGTESTRALPRLPASPL